MNKLIALGAAVLAALPARQPRGRRQAFLSRPGRGGRRSCAPGLCCSSARLSPRLLASGAIGRVAAGLLRCLWPRPLAVLLLQHRRRFTPRRQ